MNPIKSSTQLRVVIYTRISTGGQESGTSLAAQYLACAQKAKELGAVVVNHYEEIGSGGLYLARDGIQAALADIESGKANALLVYKLDRSGRDVGGLRDIRRRIQKAGAQFIFADGTQFERTPVGNLMFTQVGAFAEFERETIRDRTVRGNRATAESGRQPSRGYFAYGYRVVRKADVIRGTDEAGSEGTYVINEEEAPTAKLIFEKYLEYQSLRRVATWLAENGYRTRQDNVWKPNVLRQIMLNPVYKGAPEYGRKRRHTDESRLAKGVGIEYFTETAPEDRITLSAPPIVTVEVWDEANRVLESGRRERSGPKEFRFILTGLVYCPRCGLKMYAAKYRGRHDLAARPHQFFCGASMRFNAVTPVACPRACFRGPTMEQLTFDALERVLTEPQMLTAARREYERETARAETTKNALTETKRLEREIERLKKREKVAAEAALDARMAGSDATIYETARRDATTQLGELETRRAQLSDASQKRIADKPAIESEIGSGAVIVAALRNEEIPPFERAQILRQLVERITPLRRDPNATKWKNLNLEGVSIVLISGGRPSYVLENRVLERGQRGSILKTQIELTLRDAIPKPENAAIDA